MHKKKKRSLSDTLRRIFFSLLLLGLAGLCGFGVYHFGGNMREKDTLAREESLRLVREEEEARLAAEEKAREEAEAAQKKAKKKAEKEAAAKIAHAGEVSFLSSNDFTPAKGMITSLPAEEVNSQYALLLNLATGEILINQGGETRISPASMTKILTCLVAAEEIENLDASFTVTQEMEEYCLLNECSAAGFVGGETVPIRDLFAGTILPSGGEASVALATAACGSQKAFVKKMNQKLEDLGLSDTAHFTNCVGIYAKKHYCTLLDMAIMLKAAVTNDVAREFLSLHDWETTHTEQNPEGLILHNWFLCRIEDFDTAGEVIAAKTGFVDQSGCCAASYKVSSTGVPYICVTGNTYSEWRCIYDHISIYSKYAP